MEKQQKIIIGVAGENASGKDTVTEYLVERYSAYHYKSSIVWRNALDCLKLEHTRKNIGTVSTTLRQAFGEDVLSQVIRSEAERDTSGLVVIDGIRREEDIVEVRTLAGFYFFFVEANIQIRYQRIVGRKENSDDQTKTWEGFLADDQAEPQSRIRDLKGIADFVIDNNGTLEELKNQVDAIMEKLKV